MTPLEDTEQKQRIITALGALIMTLVFLGVCSFVFPVPQQNIGELTLAGVLFDRGNPAYPLTVQNIMWFMFFLGLSELWVRFKRANCELTQLHQNILPENDHIMLRAKDLVPIYQTVVEQKEQRYCFVQRLVQRTVLQFQVSQSIDQSNSLLNSSMELMQHEIELKYNMLRYVVWLIPTLGFIGTVIGIALALSEASNMPAEIAGDEMRTWLGMVTTKLGVAFNTTLVALIMSAILVFLMQTAQSREEIALNSAGQYCIDNLINRLYEDDT